MRALYKHGCWFMVSESEHIWFNYTTAYVVGDAWFVVRLGRYKLSLCTHSEERGKQLGSDFIVNKLGVLHSLET